MEQASESVQARCPLCPWTSDIVTVDPDSPNGRWFAFDSVVIPSYIEHFSRQHRPRPIMVVTGGPDVAPDQGGHRG